jgi:hypothetical protein
MSLLQQIKNWDKKDVTELHSMIRELTQSLADTEEDVKITDVLDFTSLGVAEKYEDEVSIFSGYPIWACDKNGWCLTGETADTVAHIESIVNK